MQVFNLKTAAEGLRANGILEYSTAVFRIMTTTRSISWITYRNTDMIHPELLHDQGILVITPEGSLQESDFVSLAKLVDPFIESEDYLVPYHLQPSEP